MSEEIAFFDVDVILCDHWLSSSRNDGVIESKKAKRRGYRTVIFSHQNETFYREKVEQELRAAGAEWDELVMRSSDDTIGNYELLRIRLKKEVERGKVIEVHIPTKTRLHGLVKIAPDAQFFLYADCALLRDKWGELAIKKGRDMY
jgi:hypothetical protein